jgi:serine/threonine protein kinase
MSLYISFAIGGSCFVGFGFYILLARRKKDDRGPRGRGRSTSNKTGSSSEREERRRRKEKRRSTFRSDRFGENGYDRRLMDEDYAGHSGSGFTFMSGKLSNPFARSNSDSTCKTLTNSTSTFTTRNSLDSTCTLASANAPDILDKSDFIINFASLHIDRMIGSGSQGQVYTGKYAATPVAIKHYAGYMALRRENSVQAEIEAKMLSRLHHPNVIRLFGICINSDECYLVMELGVQSLAEFIKSGNAAVTSDEVKRKILLQIAAGMSFLHGKGMIHRDLKPENVILDHDLNAKICDFACSRFVETGPQESMTADVGTHIYMAPELFGRMEHESDDKAVFAYTSKVDVYSFGMCVYALETGRHPFQKEQEEEQFGFLDLLNRITAGLRPSLPGSVDTDANSNGVPSEFEGLMSMCWSGVCLPYPTFKSFLQRNAFTVGLSLIKPWPLTFFPSVPNRIYHLLSRRHSLPSHHSLGATRGYNSFFFFFSVSNRAPLVFRHHSIPREYGRG